MEKSEEYLRFAKECAQMARTVKDPKNRSALLKMAQVWFRLAQEHVSDAAETVNG